MRNAHRKVSVPGRVCLAGENLDWIGGSTLTAATRDLRVTVTSSRTRSGNAHRLRSRYVQAALSVLRKEGYDLHGLHLSIQSSLPRSGGLASSAALCVATIAAATALDGVTLSPHRVAKLAFEAENAGLGIGCGKMDQHAVTLGGVLHMKFEGDTMEVTPLSVPQRLVLVIGSSNVPMGFTAVRSTLAQLWAERNSSVLSYVKRTTYAVEQLMHGMRDIVWDENRVARWMKECQSCIETDLAIVNPELGRWIVLAMDAGAVCAKSTGIRQRGGAMFALCDRGEADRVMASLLADGAAATITEFDRHGILYS